MGFRSGLSAVRLTTVGVLLIWLGLGTATAQSMSQAQVRAVVDELEATARQRIGRTSGDLKFVDVKRDGSQVTMLIDYATPVGTAAIRGTRKRLERDLTRDMQGDLCGNKRTRAAVKSGASVRFVVTFNEDTTLVDVVVDKC